MRFSRHLGLVALVVAVLALAGCDRGSKTPPPPPPSPVAVVDAGHRFTIEVGGQSVKMRLAVHLHERNRGLMHVASMPEDEGMLFVFPAPQRMSFYMRNTRIPLDIGYFNPAGVLEEIHPMHPFVEDGVVSVGEAMQFALEMNQGWYARHGVRPGAKIDLAAVSEALRQRGIAPGDIIAATP